jgi:Cytosol aminopeptidase family, catalytic domain
VVAACENMINERAYVPSDILTASNGKTIEVMNTDAVRPVVGVNVMMVSMVSHRLYYRKGVSLWPMRLCMPIRLLDVKRSLSCRL